MIKILLESLNERNANFFDSEGKLISITGSYILNTTNVINFIGEESIVGE